MAVSLLLALTVVALWLLTGAAATQLSRAAPVSSADITSGPADAGVTVIEYSDFECPYCAQYARWLERLRAHYGDRVRLVYRFFPLPGHRWATLAAEAAYAASLQGGFWRMQDLLYRNQPVWAVSEDPRPYFASYARRLGLDAVKFRADMDAPATAAFVRREAAEGRRAGVTSTPWLVIDGYTVAPRSYQELVAAVRERP